MRIPSKRSHGRQPPNISKRLHCCILSCALVSSGCCEGVPLLSSSGLSAGLTAHSSLTRAVLQRLRCCYVIPRTNNSRPINARVVGIRMIKRTVTPALIISSTTARKRSGVPAHLGADQLCIEIVKKTIMRRVGTLYYF